MSSRPERLLKHLKSTIVTGMIAGLPLAVTVWGLLWLWNLIDGAFAPVLRATVHRNIPGVSFLLLVLGVYLVGLLSENVLGRQMLHWGERVVTRVPVARSLYRGTKEVIDTFAQSKNGSFSSVVLTRFPITGQWALGFETGEVPEDLSKELGTPMAYVFIPHSPSPISGMLVLVPRSDIKQTAMSVEEGFRLIVSCGVLSNPAPAGKSDLARQTPPSNGHIQLPAVRCLQELPDKIP